MTEFGREIARGCSIWPNDGCPPWLTDGTEGEWRKRGRWVTNIGSKWSDYVLVDWRENLHSIRLPSDHFAYTVLDWNDAHPDEPPFTPWQGGGEAPSDWDGDRDAILYRDRRSEGRAPHSWHHVNKLPSDIIGYRRKSAKQEDRMTDDIVARMEALTARIASRSAAFDEDASEAREILALLPKPIDPAVLACREICAVDYEKAGNSGVAIRIRSGEYDETPYMLIALAAYRAGQSA